MGHLTVWIKIDANTFVGYYQGKIKTVVATADNGKKVSMPANILQPFVTKQGINGHFQVDFDEHGKVTNISNIGQQI